MLVSINKEIQEFSSIFLYSPASHCIQNKKSNDRLQAGDIRVILGGHDLNDPHEIGKEVRSVKNIFVHPHWNPDVIKFDADIAMLELEYEIRFNEYIQPICLWESFYEPSATSGIIVGYGRGDLDSPKKHETVPKALSVPFISQSRCFLNNHFLAEISSDRTFCAGSADGTGVCLGDSGGGLIIKHSGKYYLRGIISSSLRRDDSCDVDAHAVYTDVLKYKNWIKTLKVSDEEEECGIMSSSSGLIQKGEKNIFK